MRGAWLSSGLTRMDDQQHALSGLLYASDAIEGRTNRSPDTPAPRAGAMIETRPREALG